MSLVDDLRSEFHAALAGATSPAAARALRDQFLSRKQGKVTSLLKAVGVPVPRGRPVENAEDAWAAAQEVGTPVVVKPQYGNQGRGVTTNLTTRDQVLTARFRRGAGRTGWIEIAVDGVDAGRGDIQLYMRMISSVGPSVAFDHGSAVSTRYEAPFPFAGKLHLVEIQLLARAAPGTAEAEAAAEMSRQ